MREGDPATAQIPTRKEAPVPFLFRTSSMLRSLVVIGVALVSTLFAAHAQATYPGANGSLVYENYEQLGDSTLDPFTVAPSDPSTSRRLVGLDAAAYNFEYSPNGKLIAFEAAVPDSQIFVMKANGRKPVSVTKRVNACHGETFPSWAPNGKQIAFRCARADGFIEFDIYSVKLVMKKKGKGKHRKKVLQGKGQKRVTDKTDAYQPFWSPLGDRIAYTTSGNAVWMVPAGGGAETIVAPDDSEPGIGDGWTAVDWAPDGSVLAADGRAGIYLMDPNSGALLSDTPFVADVTEPVFSPDGTELAYTTLIGDNAPDIGATALATGTPRLITSEPGSERTPSWQPLP